MGKLFSDYFLMGFQLESDLYFILEFILMDIIKKEFEGLFRGSRSYLYAIIFNKKDVEKREKKEKKKW